MITELREDAFPEIYERFVKLLDGKPWIKATKDLQLQINQNRLSGPQIERENREAFGLTFFDEYRMRRRWDPAWAGVQEAMNFVAQVCDMVDSGLGDRGTKAYIGRVKGAFKNSRDMRALRLEHLAAVRFFCQGASITWPDESKGQETYDLLATGLTHTPIEVECKSTSKDKGRLITEKAFVDFLEHLLPAAKAASKPGEALLVRVEVPNRLPTRTSALKELASEVISAIGAGEPSTQGGYRLETHRSFPMFLTHTPQAEMKHTGLYHYALEVLGEMQGYRAIELYGNAGLVFEICSKRENDPLGKLWDTAKKAVRHQMTGTRPGCLILKLEGWSRKEFLMLTESTVNVLGVFAQELFSDEKHQHLACVVFASEEAIEDIDPFHGLAQSCIWVADRQEGAYANLGISQILLGTANPLQRDVTQPQAAAASAGTQTPPACS